MVVRGLDWYHSVPEMLKGDYDGVVSSFHTTTVLPTAGP